jgi:cyclomaltodextrinase / maltogenic alpha-amylase / neopullulanase
VERKGARARWWVVWSWHAAILLYADGAMKLCPACAFLLSAILLIQSRSFAQQTDTALAAQPARQSQAWLTSGVIYEIFPRSFSPEGNLSGITRRLDDLKNLGVSILWLMPIQPNGQIKKKGSLGSPYAVRDYYAIDPAYGNKGDLRRLVDEAHARQMKVILDIVANHTAWDSVLMAHPEFYKHDQAGHITFPHDWSDVAALDYSNPALRRYMTDMLAYWIKEFDLDGYRCDVAFEVPTDFWEQARRELERVKPGIMMLAEASKPELLRSAFDLDYSWPLLSALNDVLMRGAPASTLRATLEQQQALFPKGALHMRMSDDHDEERAMARYGLPGALAASALMFTLDGVPMLYNGMEAGDSTESGDPALFEPLKVLWQMAQRRPQFPKFYAAMIPLRRQHAALQNGQLIWVHNSDEQHVFTYIRRSADEEFLVAVNLSNTPFRGTVEAEARGWKEAPLLSSQTRETAIPALTLEAFEFRVFQARR